MSLTSLKPTLEYITYPKGLVAFHLVSFGKNKALFALKNHSCFHLRFLHNQNDSLDRVLYVLPLHFLILLSLLVFCLVPSEASFVEPCSILAFAQATS